MSLDDLPRWLGPASRVNTWVLRLNLPIGTQHVLSVPGRRTGLKRSTPVSLVTLDGSRYIVSGEGLARVANARAAGSGTLERKRRTERVALTELPPAERGPILRAVWHQRVDIERVGDVRVTRHSRTIPPSCQRS